MSVYVDKLRPCVPNRNWKYGWSCHLFADNLDELHNFAKELGLKKSWFQNSHKKLPHYDLTENKRKQAVKLGAVEILNYITWRDMKEKSNVN